MEKKVEKIQKQLDILNRPFTLTERELVVGGYTLLGFLQKQGLKEKPFFETLSGKRGTIQKMFQDEAGKDMSDTDLSELLAALDPDTVGAMDGKSAASGLDFTLGKAKSFTKNGPLIAVLNLQYGPAGQRVHQSCSRTSGQLSKPYPSLFERN